MFRVVVLGENAHRVECGYCGQKEYVNGPTAANPEATGSCLRIRNMP
jgi:hypothetical protein